MKMIGWWPSFRVTVADSPSTYRALACPRDGFEAHGGEVMAFIDDDMAVIGDQIGDDALPNQALHEGDIDDSGRLLLSAMDDAEPVRRDVQKCLQPRHPLIEKLPAMDEDQGIPIPCSDHFRGDDGLAECRGRRKHPGFMLEKSCGGFTPVPASARRETVSRVAVLAGVRRAARPRCLRRREGPTDRRGIRSGGRHASGTARHKR